jgi:hypothetical protein
MPKGVWLSQLFSFRTSAFPVHFQIVRIDVQISSTIPAVSGLATLAVLGAGAIVAGLGRRER